MKVLVTGSNGFVGKNLCVALTRREDVELFRYDVDSPPEDLDKALEAVDIIFHLAGVNRPQNTEEYEHGNAGFTGDICRKLGALGRNVKLVLSSSTQAELDNPYGVSKRGAEDALAEFCARTGAPGVTYRLKNLFGKWCRPNYNSVTATFCHNVAHDLPIQISDPENVVDLTYIDDVITAFVAELSTAEGGYRMAQPLKSRKISLGDLASLIRSFRDHRKTLLLPDFSDPFVKNLYATYLSYLEEDSFAYTLDIKEDQRGSLAEFIKAPQAGQMFISRTHPGITRGNHFHDTKTEKFLVVEGEAVIRFRSVKGDGPVLEYRVFGKDYRVVDIPPGYTHSIENVGKGEMVVLFWASEIFNPEKPDTYFLGV